MQRKLLIRDVLELDLVDEWVADSVVREASYLMAKTLVAQLEIVTNSAFVVFKLPSWIDLRPLKADEFRVRLPGSMSFSVINKTEKTMRVALPEVALDHRFYALMHITDRHSVNVSMHHALAHLNYLSFFTFGYYHAQWNGIQNAAKHTGGGRMWKVPPLKEL